MTDRVKCKFYLASNNKNYKSDYLKFCYIPECSSCFDLSSNNRPSCSKRRKIAIEDEEKDERNNNLHGIENINELDEHGLDSMDLIETHFEIDDFLATL